MQDQISIVENASQQLADERPADWFFGDASGYDQEAGAFVHYFKVELLGAGIQPFVCKCLHRSPWRQDAGTDFLQAFRSGAQELRILEHGEHLAPPEEF